MFKSLVKVGLVSMLMVGSLSAQEPLEWNGLASAVTTKPNICFEAYTAPFKFGYLENGVGSCNGNHANIKFERSDTFNLNNQTTLVDFFGSFLRGIGAPNDDLGKYCKKLVTAAMCSVEYTDVKLTYFVENGNNTFSLGIQKIK